MSARKRPRPTDLPVRRVERHPDTGVDPGSWPATLPPVAQLLREGLDLGPVTVLVGENGSGKSTIVEAVAMAYGLSPEGGTTHARHRTRRSESPLHEALRIVRNAGSSRWGFFLRAETMHGFYTYLEGLGGPDPDYHGLSHGESFLAVLNNRFDGPGLYVLDEPESALSFSGCLALVGVVNDLAATGTAQVLLSTHSPVLAAIPGARILEAGPWGLRETRWEDLELVQHWRAFLRSPDRYLRHLEPDP